MTDSTILHLISDKRRRIAGWRAAANQRLMTERSQVIVGKLKTAIAMTSKSLDASTDSIGRNELDHAFRLLDRLCKRLDWSFAGAKGVRA